MKDTVEFCNGFRLSIDTGIDLGIDFNDYKGYKIMIESPEGDEISCQIQPSEMEVIKNMFDSIRLVEV